MAECCPSPGNDEKFTATTAASTALRYRRKGTLRRERDLLDPVLATGVEDAVVLEIGGGVGQLQLELLKAGAASAVNVELSPNYEDVAFSLADDAGFSDRVTRIVGDATAVSPPPADVALLYRVVCCTTDAVGMLRTALSAGVRTVGMTLPHVGPVARVVVAVTNLVERLKGSTFRMRLHDPAMLVGVAETAGLQVVHDRRRLFWRTIVLAS